ncbi:LysR family transcriptional regulator [Paracoccus saliphilus]|uniref:LysR family transcriptional regulator n=1 Tax=Paracoccus saliphilus TaxID=405559 RepID=A0AA45W526_9RHOB|nr:LysR family transcriptional regulator [Paracoccus saliphilus]WCR02140.1 LysR family transcriptional regulator [Paracoccus saliphilus]SIS90424.1 transcriptional regulator, LysR family [Paracoccus saliphilus]
MSYTVTWDDQRIFLAVLEEGSLSAAARKLGLSHPTVRSRIGVLEQQLDAVLFTRSVNGLTPTETAEMLREPARRMSMASDLFVRQASASSGAIAGTVRISVPEFMGIEVMPAMLAQLRNAHPGIKVELSLSNLPADLLTQEVDVAVRTVAPKQEALVARKVASIPLGLFASRAYIERHGSPANIADLASHDMIGPDRNRRDLDLAERLGPGFTRNNLVLRTDNHPAQLAAARAGVGIAVAQLPVGENDPNLIRILPDFELAVLETWIVTHENLVRVPRVRAVFDALVDSFRSMSKRK